MKIVLHRVYGHAKPPAGIKILADRIWPRGIAKNEAPWDIWMKDLAPSAGLRKWFGHDPGKWEEFKVRYFAELSRAAGALAPLRKLLSQGETVVLCYAAKDTERNNAVALREYLESTRP